MNPHQRFCFTPDYYYRHVRENPEWEAWERQHGWPSYARDAEAIALIPQFSYAELEAAGQEVLFK